MAAGRAVPPSAMPFLSFPAPGHRHSGLAPGRRGPGAARAGGAREEWRAETDGLIGQLRGLRAAMSEDRRAAEATIRAQRAEIERMRRADEHAAGPRAEEMRRMGGRLE